MPSDKYRELYDQNRRQFLKISMVGGLASIAGCTGGGDDGDGGDGDGDGDGGGGTATPAPQVEGDTPAERAINGINQLDSKPDKLDMLVWSGSEAYFNKIRDQWVDQTGIDFKMHGFGITETFGKLLSEATTQSPKFDINVAANFGTPDLVEANYLESTTDWVRKYDPDMETFLGLPRRWGIYKGENYAFSADADVMQPFIRTDWVEDEDFKEEFEAQYGRELRRPKTIEEYDQQIKFFTENTEDGVYGAWFYMAPFFAKWTFIRRLLQRGELLFDMDFRPNFNSKAGVETLKNLRELKPFLHPEVSSAGFGVPYTEFPAGNIYTTVQWPSLYRTLTQGDVALSVDQWEPIKAPGREVDGEFIRPAQYTMGQAFRVNKHGNSPEAAYLFTQWLTDTEISAEAIQAGGFIEPFRKSHYENSDLGQFLAAGDWEHDFEVFLWNFEHSYPDLTIRRVNEYNNAIDSAVTNVLNNNKDPQTELDKAANKVEEITNSIGRDEQKQIWQSFLSIWGKDLRDPLGLPDPPDSLPWE